MPVWHKRVAYKPNIGTMKKAEILQKAISFSFFFSISSISIKKISSHIICIGESLTTSTEKINLL